MVKFEDLDIGMIDMKEGMRQILDKQPLEELAASIEMHGTLQPLVVELQIGRRMAAAKMVGLNIVPAIVLEGSPARAARTQGEEKN